jgi:uncharacterized protein YqjF (DUF2071 family)
MTHPSASSCDPIDRLGPSVRPDRRAIMRQDWHQLLFLHWDIDPGRLRPLIPPGLDLDLHEGRAYVGLVPFTMSGIRPVGMPPLPWLSRFHETNVRTYVHCGGRDPGVWFFSLDAANPVAVAAARLWFHLPYHRAAMSLVQESPGPGTPGGRVSYASVRRWRGPVRAACSVACVPRGSAAPAAPGTLEAFLVERYFLYTSWRGRLYRGQVHHRPYPLQAAEVTSLDESLLAAAGIERPASPPLAHFAEGVRVEVFPLTCNGPGAP